MLTFPIGVFIWLQLNSYKIIRYVAIYVATTVHDKAWKVFITDQTKLDPKHYSVKCMGSG